MRFNRCPRYVVLTLCIEVNLILVTMGRKERKRDFASKGAASAHSKKNQTSITAGQLQVPFTGSPAL